MPIIVHIGPPKTATTTIQKALEYNNDNVLKDNNIQYIINSKCKKDILFFAAHINSPHLENIINRIVLNLKYIKKMQNCFLKN